VKWPPCNRFIIETVTILLLLHATAIHPTDKNFRSDVAFVCRPWPLAKDNGFFLASEGLTLTGTAALSLFAFSGAMCPAEVPPFEWRVLMYDACILVYMHVLWAVNCKKKLHRINLFLTGPFCAPPPASLPAPPRLVVLGRVLI
jgi:hypothetical protein